MSEEAQRQFLVNYAIDRLTAFLMEDRRITLEQALDTVYASRVYDLLQDRSIGLTADSPAYIYELMKHDFLRIIAAEHVTGYMLKLTFSNGDVRIFDFSSIYDKGIFTKLRNPEYFRNYTLDGWSVEWNDEIGFAPEYLYEQGTPTA